MCKPAVARLVSNWAAPVAGTQYDQLRVGGSATLDGTLNVSLANGFTPADLDSFQVLTFGSRSGDFAVKNGLDWATIKS